MNLLVRTEAPPESAITAIRAQISSLDRDQPITDVETAEDLIESRFTTLLIGGFSATALVLAIVGIYGILSCAVAQRRQEFGIRLALGAEPTEILRIVMRQAISLASAGIVTGLCAALILTRMLENALYDTGSRDLTAFLAAPVLFLAVTYWPATCPRVEQ